MEATMEVTNRIDRKTKPSSPREFFDKIYGDSEKLYNSSYSIVEHLLRAKRTNRSEWKLDYQPMEDKGRRLRDRFLPRSNIEYSSTSWNETGPASRDRFSSGPSVESSTLWNGIGPPSIQSLSRGLSIFLERKKRKGGKLRRQRTTFSSEQTLQLENEFRANEYIPRTRRQKLAEYLQLTEMQIKIWFQNRRAKDKRIEKAQLDQQYRSLIAARVISIPSWQYNCLHSVRE